MVEETARIDKREVQTGRVKVHTVVETSEQMVREALSSQNVKVTRVAVDQPVTTVPEIRTEDGITIVPVLEEIRTCLRRQEVGSRQQRRPVVFGHDVVPRALSFHHRAIGRDVPARVPHSRYPS